MMIPANVDHRQILSELNAWGIRDYKIEAICGFSIGYVAQLKSGNVKQMSYQRAARLYNFHLSELELRGSRGTVDSHSLAGTTT